MPDISSIGGFSVRPDVSLADVEQLSKPAVQGALPPAIAPLSTPEQHQIIGATSSHADALRLESPGETNSAYAQIKNIRSVLQKLNTPVQSHPFSQMEGLMKPILEQHLRFMNQIASELSNGRT